MGADEVIFDSPSRECTHYVYVRGPEPFYDHGYREPPPDLRKPYVDPVEANSPVKVPANKPTPDALIWSARVVLLAWIGYTAWIHPGPFLAVIEFVKMIAPSVIGLVKTLAPW